MTDENARVNHPSYYEKSIKDNRKHPECIYLLELLTEGLPGIIAYDLGNLKYLYRFGSKAEEGLSKKEKAVEDVSKIGWYGKDLTLKWHSYSTQINFVEYKPSTHNVIAQLIAEEFVFDKPESVKNAVRDVILYAYLLKTTKADPDKYFAAVQNLISVVSDTKDEEWN